MFADYFRITYDDLFRNCLLSSIAHSIMTNEYPMLSYEQSWDGKNYSIVDDMYRCTISFENSYCLGAIRNDESKSISGDSINKLITNEYCDDEISGLLNNTLTYMLDNCSNIVSPVVTSIFLCKQSFLVISSSYNENIQKDINAIAILMQPTDKCIEHWKWYYNMSEEALVLLKQIFNYKVEHFFSPMKLTTKQKESIPGRYICDECVESFRELNIIL